LALAALARVVFGAYDSYPVEIMWAYSTVRNGYKYAILWRKSLLEIAEAEDAPHERNVVGMRNGSAPCGRQYGRHGGLAPAPVQVLMGVVHTLFTPARQSAAMTEIMKVDHV